MRLRAGRTRLLLLFGAWLALAACGTKKDGRAVKLQHLPPTPKDVIDVVMASSQTPMTDASCKGYGTEAGDATIGRYLAGFLAELSNAEARNAVTTSVEQGTESGEAVYVCRLMIRHAQGEDVWSWGVQFSARRSDGKVLAGSFRCIGAG